MVSLLGCGGEACLFGLVLGCACTAVVASERCVAAGSEANGRCTCLW